MMQSRKACLEKWLNQSEVVRGSKEDNLESHSSFVAHSSGDYLD